MANIAESLLELFKNNKNCDITFKVKCGRFWSSFPAHKLILSIWSPVLADKFQPDNYAFDEEFEIVDIRPSTFSAFLNYLYGCTKELKENEKDVKFIIDVYEVACKFQVQQLKIHCCNILNSFSPNKDNIFDLIDVASLINSSCLREQCYTVLKRETEEILNSYDIQTVTPYMITTLLQLPNLWLSSEYELLVWIFKWAKSYYLKQQNIKSPREIISPHLPYLNFTALKSGQFATLVNDHREFFDEIECFNIFMNINLPGSTDLPDWYDKSRNSHDYKKPLQNASMLGDFVPELGYSVNNVLASDHLDTYKNAVLGSNASISSTISEVVPINDIAINSNLDGSIPCNTSITHCLKSPAESMEEATHVEIDINNPEESSITSLPKMIQCETQTDETLNVNNEICTSSICPKSSVLTIEKAIQTEIEMDSEGVEANSSKLTLPLPMIDNVTQTEGTMNSNNEIASLDGCLAVQNSNEISPILNDNEESSPLFSTTDVETQADEIDASITPNPPMINNKTEEDEITPLDSNSAVQQNAEISSVLDILYKELESSWNSLKPKVHLKKIKKKKIRKFYRMSEGGSLPNVGVWDSTLESIFLSGDFTSLNFRIEKQLSLPLADDILSKSFRFPEGKAPCIFGL